VREEISPSCEAEDLAFAAPLRSKSVKLIDFERTLRDEASVSRHAR
jgi:hypothetical protein